MVVIRDIIMEQGDNCTRITEQICALVGMTNNKYKLHTELKKKVIP